MSKQPKNRKKPSLLKRFLNRRKDKDITVNSNKITIFYDQYLEKITGVPFEETMISEDFAFADCLHSLFVSYPEIPKRVLPGKLGFLLNGMRPETFDALKDGDKVEFIVMDEQVKPTQEQIEAVRDQLKAEIFELIRRYEVDISLEKIKETIFNESKFKDFHLITASFSEKIEDLNEANWVLSVLMKAWNYFPHESLGGRCPMERFSELQKNNPYLK